MSFAQHVVTPVFSLHQHTHQSNCVTVNPRLCHLTTGDVVKLLYLTAAYAYLCTCITLLSSRPVGPGHVTNDGMIMALMGGLIAAFVYTGLHVTLRPCEPLAEMRS